MRTQTLEYTDGKSRFLGYLAWDETQTGRRPGIVVFPEAFGLNDHARTRAERLAGLGYVALAADPHGEGVAYRDMASLREPIQALYADRTMWRSRAQAALDALTAQSQVDAARLGAIGFCFGGTTCLELARSGAPLRVITTFHAGLNTELPEDVGRIRAKVLVCHGAEDPIVTPESIATFMAAMRRDKVDWQLIYYGNAMHSFTNPKADDARSMPGLAYNKTVEERSWAAMRQLFEESFR